MRANSVTIYRIRDPQNPITRVLNVPASQTQPCARSSCYHLRKTPHVNNGGNRRRKHPAEEAKASQVRNHGLSTKENARDTSYMITRAGLSIIDGTDRLQNLHSRLDHRLSQVFKRKPLTIGDQ